MPINLFVLPAITASIFSIIIGVYVYSKNPKNIQNRVFVLLIISLSFFCIGEVMLRLSRNIHEGLFWGRIGYLGAIFVPITFLHLCSIFPRERLLHKKLNYILYIIYILGIVLVLFFNFNVSSNDIKSSIWGYRLALNPSLSFIGIWVVVISFFAFINLLIGYQISESIIEKKQIKHVFYGSLIAAALLVLTNLIPPLLNMYVFPMATIGFSILAFFIGAAILKHSLFIYRPMTETVIKPEKMALLNRDELKKEVNARTSALLKTNEELSKEIEERKKIEQELKKSLEEKEILLKEAHHRVKNNLQIISSLLYLQLKKFEDEKTKEVFLEIYNRIKSMSLIHERLYQSKNLAKINCNEYITKLINNLLQSHGQKIEDIQLDINVRDVFLGIDIATPCGLIINEVVSNSLKHAFPNNTKGKISIDLHKEEENFILTIKDNGVGLQKNLVIQKTETLGLSLVKNLVKQLNGILEINSNDGTEFKVTFPETKEKA